MQSKKDKSSSSLDILGKVNGFVRLHFVHILIVIAVLLASLVVFLTVRGISASTREKAMNRIVALEERFNSYITDSNASSEDAEGTENAESADTAAKDEVFDELVSDLEKELRIGIKYSSSKAGYILGRLYFNKSDYESAIKAYERATEKQNNTYLAGLIYLNLAECYQLSGNSLKALETYGKAADLDVEFGIRAKAYINMGAIAEKNGDMDLATSYMRQAAELESYSEYGKLAKNWLLLH